MTEKPVDSPSPAKVPGISYSIEELRLASQQPGDIYHLDLMRWAAAELATVKAERDRYKQEFEFQSALTKSLLPYQERAVTAEAEPEVISWAEIARARQQVINELRAELATVKEERDCVYDDVASLRVQATALEAELTRLRAERDEGVWVIHSLHLRLKQLEEEWEKEAEVWGRAESKAFAKQLRQVREGKE